MSFLFFVLAKKRYSICYILKLKKERNPNLTNEK